MYYFTTQDEFKKAMSIPDVFEENMTEEWRSDSVLRYIYKDKSINWVKDQKKDRTFIGNVGDFEIKISERRAEINGKKLNVKRTIRLYALDRIETNYYDLLPDHSVTYKLYRSGQDLWSVQIEKELDKYHSCYKYVMSELDKPGTTYANVLSLYTMLSNAKFPCNAISGESNSVVTELFEKFIEKVLGLCDWKVTEISMNGMFSKFFNGMNHIKLVGDMNGSECDMRILEGVLCINNTYYPYSKTGELVDKILTTMIVNTPMLKF